MQLISVLVSVSECVCSVCACLCRVVVVVVRVRLCMCALLPYLQIFRVFCCCLFWCPTVKYKRFPRLLSAQLCFQGPIMSLPVPYRTSDKCRTFCAFVNEGTGRSCTSFSLSCQVDGKVCVCVCVSVCDVHVCVSVCEDVYVCGV